MMTIMLARNIFINTAKCSATENYYSTLMHELKHWTRHELHLNYKIKNKFGSDAYAEEELVAEFGIVLPEMPNSAAYIANWIKVLKDNIQG